MKVIYIVKPKRTEYEGNKSFTFQKEYKVLADYRKRQSGQKIADNGLVVIDDNGIENMLFQNQVEIVEDGEKCFIFNYK
jgi:hypothetical protein